MAWQKIPAENHAPFYAALPEGGRFDTIRMFGGVAAMVNGNMAAGLWADSVMVRLAAPDQAAALKKGAAPFDPMGKGRPMKDMLLLPSAVLGKKAELRGWLTKAITFTATLPPKVKGGMKAANKPSATKAAKKPAAKKPAAKRPAAKKPAVKKPAVSKPAAKKVAAKKVASKPAAKKARARRAG